MLVAFVVKYTNSIVKGFAASGSIVLSCLISAIFLNDYKLNNMFTLGTSIVCASAFIWAVSKPNNSTKFTENSAGSSENSNKIDIKDNTIIDLVQENVLQIENKGTEIIPEKKERKTNSNNIYNEISIIDGDKSDKLLKDNISVVTSENNIKYNEVSEKLRNNKGDV